MRLAAPASTAAMPMTRSEPCWNPAVPPPPVAGAAVGPGLAVGLGETVGDGLGDVVGDGDGDGLVVGLGLELGLELGLVLGEPEPVADVLAEDDTDGDVVGSAPDEGDPEHAERVTEASTATMPQQTAASLTLDLLPATVLRTFMEPPHASGRKRRGP
jgi:hypothetical protein